MGASGFIKTGKPFEKGFRWTNMPILKDYYRLISEGILPQTLTEEIDTNTAIREYLMLVLRRKRGLNFTEFEKEFGYSIQIVLDFKRLEELSPFVEIDLKGFRIRKEQLFVSNAVIRKIWELVDNG